MIMEYLKTPLHKYTFSIRPIREWVEKNSKGKVLNLFAGKTKLNLDEFRVDCNKDMLADVYMDAFEFVTQCKDKFDTILLDPPYCYDDQTEVLTDSGFKFFKDLEKTDKVATLNKDTGIVEYYCPTDFYINKYNGEMIKIKSGSIDLLVTPNHNLYISRIHSDKFYFIEAKDLNYGCEFKAEFNWIAEDKEFFCLPEVKFDRHNRYGEKFKKIRKIPMDIWLRFLGIYLSEGSVDQYGTHYRIRISQKKEENRKIIKKWLDELGFHFIVEKNDFIIYDKQLCVYLRQLGKVFDKFIPYEIKQLSNRQLNILLDALILGDGHRSSKPRYNAKYNKTYIDKHLNYCSHSKRLINDVNEIALKAGYVCSIFARKDGGYSVNLGHHRKTPMIIRSKIEKYINKVQYNGNIYCITVPNNVIYVRRNKNMCWCGNSERKSMEMYNGKKVSKFNKIKDFLPNLLNDNGIIITFGYHCLDEKTQCLTENGWKYYYELDKNDKIATFNRENEKIEYSKIKDMFLYNHDGLLKRISDRHIDQLITLNHKVALKYKHQNNNKKGENVTWKDKTWQLIKANSITPHSGIYIPVAGIYNGNKKIGLEMAELLGWIISEGHMLEHGSVFIHQSIKNKKNVDRIRKLLVKCKLFFTEKIYKGNPYLVNFYISKRQNKKFYNLLGHYIISPKKPKWNLLHLRNNELKALFDGLVMGDGSRYTNKSCIFYQKSNYCREWFQVLSCHLGYRTVNNMKNKTVNVKFSNEKYISNLKFRNNFKNVLYKGKIWCINIKNNCFVIRRNNKVSITGNSVSMGQKRGFKQDKILLMSHSGGIHDTIAVIERKINENNTIK